MSKASTIPEGIVAEMKRLGFTWAEDPQYDLTRLKERVQVRLKDLAPTKEVERYAEAMHYSKFPPIIVTEDDALVEGNTRVAAYAVNKTPNTWAIIINAKNSDPDPVIQARLHALAVGINNQNGRAHTDADNRDAAALAARAGWKVGDIAETLKVTPKTAGEIVREVAAESKLTSLGVPLNGGMTKKQLRVLGSPKVLDMNGEPYKELAMLTRDAALNVTEVRDLAKGIRDAGSDEAALSFIKTARAEMGNRISEVSLTGTSNPKPPSLLRRALGNVLKYEDNPTALVEFGADYKELHLATVERCIAVLTLVAAEQRQA